MTWTLDDPIHLGSLHLKNRLIMAPLQQYKGTFDAFPIDHHIEHYGRRAKHVGLVILESTAISSNGRLWSNDIGIFTDQHVAPLRKIADAIHAHQTPAFIQLSHGGRKSSPEVTNFMVAPSAIAFDDHYGTPEPLSLAGIQTVIEEYRLAAKRTVEAGFDGIEIHAAHGFLIHQFLSPLSNIRLDDYGGNSENRARFLKEVLLAIRGEVGRQYPVTLRISATDYFKGGLTTEELVRMLQPLECELDAIHVSTGGLLPIQPSDVHTGYQVPYAAAIKQHFHIPVIAVGKIYTRSLANRILEDQLADCIAIGSPLLTDPDYAECLLTHEDQVSSRG
ncbi:NADH:flavin oxidoreductase [Paenibacillus qinlingensis]|uniref:oxidoreductase n=1 Tax=Paenibacillus qinlingensis TaxID=1837343 RepID=UPI0015658D4B|nr:NADH:flavin oxidoreductase [Paenibacillus qinlingensis]NQX58079.1 NADH:flavin oxidoreductase [Paenibacillus qinlingensis]